MILQTRAKVTCSLADANNAVVESNLLGVRCVNENNGIGDLGLVHESDR